MLKQLHQKKHGVIHKNADKFPTIGYLATIKSRSIELVSLPKGLGDSLKGELLVYSKKARCLNCHILGPDGQQAGNIDPNLSLYGNYDKGDAYTFQQIWDPRSHNSKTIMPPYGTNDILTTHEVSNIIAYLNTLKKYVEEPKRPKVLERNFYVAGEDLTLADIYIESGEKLFNLKDNNGKSCKSCHDSKQGGINLKGVASSYPKYSIKLQRVIGLEEQQNICISKYTNTKPYPLGSRFSNELSRYIKFLSRNIEIDINTKGQAVAGYYRGKKSFFKKVGQLNLSCASCHTGSTEKWLRDVPLSSINADTRFGATARSWPRHFIARHDRGLISLRQRIRHCQIVTRTQPLQLDSQEYIDLEFYLTSLANGQAMLAPTKSKLRGEE